MNKKFETIIQQFSHKEGYMLYTLKGTDVESMRQIEEEMNIRQTKEIFLLFALGSQFDHLIKQKLDTLGVFCLMCDPASVTDQDVGKIKPKGIILSGGPASVYEEPPPFDQKIFNLGYPVLGICLGFQLWARHIGAKVRLAEKREFGTHIFRYLGSENSKPNLFTDCPPLMLVLDSHGDIIEADGKFEVLGETDNCPVAAGRSGHLWGVQFHPEVTETIYGDKIFHNFCFEICQAKDRFPAERVAEKKIEELRRQIGDKKVLLALSGGSDSSTVAYLLKHALGGRKEQLHAVYIKGIDRPDDEFCVMTNFANQGWLTLEIIDATEKFLSVLAGKTFMRDKRVAMRSVYKEVLEEAARRFGADFIAQGTLYTDISESGGGYDSGAKKAQIKLHHNVKNGFSLPELTPLDDCVKDTGKEYRQDNRRAGRAFGPASVSRSRTGRQD